IACCVRIMIASEKPRSSITRPRTTYMTPMRLWSTLVSHSRHRYGHQPFTVTIPSATRTTAATTAALMSGSGSLKGIAAQLSLPSISTPFPGHRRAPARVDIYLRGSRRSPVEDALEQVWGDRPISDRRSQARLCQLGKAGVVERRAGAPRLPQPGVELARRHGLDHEAHVGEVAAAEVGRDSLIV